MMNAKNFAKYDSMHNNSMNYALKSSKNNELGVQKCMLSHLIQESHSKESSTRI